MLPRTGDRAHMGSSAWGLLLGSFYKFESTVSREIKTKFDLPIMDSYTFRLELGTFDFASNVVAFTPLITQTGRC